MASTVTLALPSKGAIAEPTISFLRDCGLSVERPNPRQYTASIPSQPSVSVLFQRATDVLFKVADGTAQLGITGLDIVLENPHANIVMISDQLGYGHCKLVVAVPESWVDVDNMYDLSEIALDFRDQKRRSLRVATKYPLLARQFLRRHHIQHFSLAKAEGAIEAGPNLGYADVIIDLTQTGTTLRENHLKILRDGTIVDSQACLIGNRTDLLARDGLLENLRSMVEYIDAAHEGRKYSQVVANIRGASEVEVGHLVSENPTTMGLVGPTIAPLYSAGSDAKEHWFTITLMVRHELLLDAVKHLRSIGGGQIVTSPVRYVFMRESPTFRRLLDLLQTE